MVSLGGIGTAFPPETGQQEIWERFFVRHYAGPYQVLARRLFANAGVERRHTVVSPLSEDVSGWSTSQRMARYLAEAVPLGKDAVTGALAATGLDATDLGMFVVCSCTGYAAPGLDILLARDLGMGKRTRRLLIGHMGCYAALPGLGAASEYVSAHGRPALLLCLELTSLHMQPPSRDPQQMIVHALFSDAAAAAVLLPDGPGERDGRRYVLRDLISVTDTATADHMTWDITETGFRMGLSPAVPDVLAAHVRDLVVELLAPAGLDIRDVEGWAVHPGGPRIIDVVRDECGLTEQDVAESRQTLANHGNCSSPTVLMVIDALRRRPSGAPKTVVALAFGPGLTLYAALLTSS